MKELKQIDDEEKNVKLFISFYGGQKRSQNSFYLSLSLFSFSITSRGIL
jgi:hypothetical protein